MTSALQNNSIKYQFQIAIKNSEAHLPLASSQRLIHAMHVQILLLSVLILSLLSGAQCEIVNSDLLTGLIIIAAFIFVCFVLMAIVITVWCCRRRAQLSVKPTERADEWYTIPPTVEIIRNKGAPPEGAFSTDQIPKVPYRSPTTLPFLPGAVEGESGSQGYPTSPTAQKHSGVHLPPIYHTALYHSMAYPAAFTPTRPAKN